MIDQKTFETFRRMGGVKFDGLISDDIVAALREKIRKHMEATGVPTDGIWASEDRDSW